MPERNQGGPAFYPTTEWFRGVIQDINTNMRQAANRVQTQTRRRIPRQTGSSKKWFRVFPRRIGQRGGVAMRMSLRGALPLYWERLKNHHPELKQTRALMVREGREVIRRALQSHEIEGGGSQ